MVGASLLASCSITPDAAVVNAKPISVAQLNSELAAITSNKAFVSQVESSSQPVFGAGSSTYATSFVAQILNRRISVDLVEQALARAHYRLSAVDLAIGRQVATAGFGGSAVFNAFPASYQAQLAHDTAAINALQAYLEHVSLTQAAINAYYSANKANLVEYCVSQILVGTQAQAATLQHSIAQGANFASTAASQSLDTNSASKGGAIGCGRIADFTRAFGAGYAQVVAGLALNTVSSPVQISNGWVILEVTAKSLPPETTDVAVVVGALLGANAQAVLASDIQRFAKHSSISVNPAYGTLSIKSGNVAVIPPSTPSKSALNYFRTPAP
jgi:hypothetical protein